MTHSVSVHRPAALWPTVPMVSCLSVLLRTILIGRLKRVRGQLLTHDTLGDKAGSVQDSGCTVDGRSLDSIVSVMIVISGLYCWKWLLKHTTGHAVATCSMACSFLWPIQWLCPPHCSDVTGVPSRLAWAVAVSPVLWCS